MGGALLVLRPIVSLAFGVLAFAALADLRAPPVDEAELAAFNQACTHYEARAASARARRPGEFVVFLAEACSAARTLLETGTPEQRRRSALLLWRISELRRVVSEINSTRARRLADDPDDRRPGHVPVNPAGEFLIAHRLGVLAAFDVWLDSGVRFSVASYP